MLLSANQVFHTEVNDLLLTALARALGKLFNEQEISILLEGHGRESLQDDIDISKTMAGLRVLCLFIYLYMMMYKSQLLK